MKRAKSFIVNEAVEEMFGYKPEEIIGKNLTQLMPERLRSQHNTGISRYLKTNKKKSRLGGNRVARTAQIRRENSDGIIVWRS